MMTLEYRRLGHHFDRDWGEDEIRQANSEYVSRARDRLNHEIEFFAR